MRFSQTTCHAEVQTHTTAPQETSSSYNSFPRSAMGKFQVNFVLLSHVFVLPAADTATKSTCCYMQSPDLYTAVDSIEEEQ